jgi:arsenate reductase-like glutaredoxin family protein
MKIKHSFLFAAIFLMSSTLFASGKTATELATLAVSNDSAISSTAINELRTLGAVGLDALFVKYAADIERFAKTGEADENWRRIANAIDSVAMQKDAYASHLYWYTDLDEAKRVAKAKNKPILTLWLLGNLNEEFSCANSRLFRAVLYSNVDVSKYIRDNYILHWKSVRPAPRITIDFGDGRKIERTITGNSIHYILDSDGEVIDAIPGLYSPAMFLKYITQSSEMNKTLSSTPNNKHAVALMKYRKTNFDQIIQNRNKTIETSGVQMTETRSGSLAILAAPMAVSKAIVVDEYSILRVYDDFAKFEPAVNFDDWNTLAKLYSPEQKIDENSAAFIRRQNAKTGLSESEFKALFAKLDSFIALDTTRNDFLFHTKLYEWLNRGRGSGDLESLNAQVYDAIFQTPNYDRWLGLYSNDVYTALDGNGIIK